MKKRFIRVVAAAVAAAALLSGCGGDKKQPVNGITEAGEADVYPIKGGGAESGTAAITYWGSIDGTVSTMYKNFGDTPFAKELEKRTGIKVEYQHPVSGKIQEQFNLMVSSGELPDIIEYYWQTVFPGGPEIALKDNIIAPLNDIIEDYAPNLKKLLESDNDVSKAVKTDGGLYYAFPFVLGHERLLTTYGPVARKDWLDELGLEIPETMDDWHNMLTLFRDKKNAEAPFAYDRSGNTFGIYEMGIFSGAFGLMKGLYVDGGKVKYGPYEPKYKDFLATIAKWYKEGLIDKSFVTADAKSIDSYILNDKTGASAVYPGSGLGKYNPELKKRGASIIPVPYPVMSKGDVPGFTSRSNSVNQRAYAIGASSENKELAARYLDYGYSGEGNMLYNFGIEGLTYNMESDYPKMTDFVMKNPDGLNVAQAWGSYSRAISFGPYVQRKEYSEQYLNQPEQQMFYPVWGQNTNAAEHLFPPVTPNEEESDRFGKIITDVKTYVDEYSLKVILGTESIDNFDKYVSALKSMGIEEAIKIQQAAYERYLKK